MTPYVDAEALLVAALADFGEVGTVLPDGLADLPLYIRVRRVGGADDRITDAARMAVDVFAPTRAAAWEQARLIQQHLISGPRAIPGAGIIDRVRTEVGPQETPYDTPGVRCVTAIYVVSSRRPH
ncbi:hypothetical protein [uncultured Thermomonospora sp.]|uniref:hypothetical protein n=1 Tax=uncultured Thermomonospora sp. TaxID=671175 RepID=UPI00259B1FEB|nr:hypothetical protein [uncultured Thermomonospora sp.]